MASLESHNFLSFAEQNVGGVTDLEVRVRRGAAGGARPVLREACVGAVGAGDGHRVLGRLVDRGGGCGVVGVLVLARGYGVPSFKRAGTGRVYARPLVNSRSAVCPGASP